MKEFHGKVRKLIRQKSASLVIEEVFAQYANSTQRSQLVEEFYGPQYALFKGTGGSSLADLLKESPAKKPYVMKHLREAIDSIIDKGQADIGPHSIVHKIILEYLNHADASDIVTLIEPLKDQIIRILHTREGSRLSQIVFAHATAKDRKHIIKTFKSYLAKITKEQYGYGVLLSVLESTDDTVLSGKACIGEIVSDNNQLKECCMDQHASKVILHALVGRNKKYLNPSLVSQLESLDAIKSSKKDDALKHIELLAVWKQPLKDVVMKNFEELVKDRYGSHVVAEVLRVLGDDELFSKLTEALSKPTGSHNSSAGAVKNEDVEISTEGEDGSQKDGDGSESDEAYQTAPESTPQRKPFHPIKALSAELNKALTPTNTEHILINRTSNSIIKELITSGRRVAISETPPLAPDTEIAGKLSDIVALAIQPSIALLLEYCSEDVKRSSGIAFLLVGLVERGTEEARKVVLDGISSFGVEKLRGEVERQKSGMEEKKTESDVNKKREKRKRDDEGTETKSSMSGLEVLLHRCTQIVA
jgi:pumilio family protein 6